MKIPKIILLPSGRYFCQLRVGGRSISITEDTYDEVEAKAYAFKGGLIAASDNKIPSLTLMQAAEKYLAERPELSPSTVRGYRKIMQHRFPALFRLMLSDITSAKCQTAVDIERKNVSPKTVKNSWAFVSGVLRENEITVYVRLPRPEKNERNFLSPSEIQIFCSEVAGTRTELPALLALHSLRCSELLGLRWKDVDIENKTVSVRGALVRGENDELVRRDTGKTAASVRKVPIFIPRLVNILSNEKPEHKAGDPVVRLTNNMIYKDIRAVCARTGLPAIGIHGLRHSFASLAYALNIPEKVAMQIGGWSNYATMRNIYTHVADELQKQNVDKLYKFFGNDC